MSTGKPALERRDVDGQTFRRAARASDDYLFVQRVPQNSLGIPAWNGYSQPLRLGGAVRGALEQG